MNAKANESTVKGDFSGKSVINYRSGTARFYRQNGAYRMRLERGEIRRVYSITQTIGSRFYQYYVGKLIEGPEPKKSQLYSVDHVLPFGYWLEQQQWVPTVHVHWALQNGVSVDEESLSFEDRPDPFAAPHESFPFTAYHSCNRCHTTFSLGDQLVRSPHILGRTVPVPMHLNLPAYFAETHPDLWDSRRVPAEMNDDALVRFFTTAWNFEAPEHAVSLGITCEACHLGSKAHVEGRLSKPYFFPQSRHLDFSRHPRSGIMAALNKM